MDLPGHKHQEQVGLGHGTKEWGAGFHAPGSQQMTPDLGPTPSPRVKHLPGPHTMGSAGTGTQSRPTQFPAPAQAAPR